MKTTLQVLEEARELISAPERWTQGAYAKDRAGQNLYEGYHPSAVRWCALGACEYAAKADVLRVRTALHRATAPAWAHDFNDTHTHAEVLAAFDRAIASERDKEKA